MKKRRNDTLNASDKKYVKEQVKAIKKAKKSGEEVKAQRLAYDLYQFLGWNDGF